MKSKRNAIPSSAGAFRSHAGLANAASDGALPIVLKTFTLLFSILVAAFGVESAVPDETAEIKSPRPKLKNVAFEGGEVFEVRPDFSNGRLKTNLFRFHKNGKFDWMSSSVVGLLDTARWERNGDMFKVTARSNEQWFAEGRFTTDGIVGSVRHLQSTWKFSGRKVDYKQYEFPLEQGEIIVLMRMTRYLSFDEVLGRKPPWPAAEIEDRFDPPFGVSGFEFKVLAPQEFKGTVLRSHHDGDIPSGPALAIASPGKTYLWRTERFNIYDTNSSICSINLHWMKDMEDITEDPRYRPSKRLLEGFSPAKTPDRPRENPAADGTKPIR